MKRNRGFDLAAPIVAHCVAGDAWAAAELINGLRRRELISMIAIMSSWVAELLEREYGDDALAVVQDIILQRESREQ